MKIILSKRKFSCPNFCWCFLFFIPSLVFSQTYPPAAGMPGSTAIYKDSSIFVNWVVGCSIILGYQDVSNPSGGKVFVGSPSMAMGKALSNGVVSLGDGGQATCFFPYPIMNGPGFDFAVFENSIDDSFLELAFVEVSSDGTNFFRFPSHSLSDTITQTGSFGSTAATKIHNFAGKYRAGYGTPFDLQDLANVATLNTNYITHVRIVDVVGSLLSQYATRDSHNNKVNDPWPTAFSSGGFDLDAIGVIHENQNVGVQESSNPKSFKLFPQPIVAGEKIHIESKEKILQIEILSSDGRIMNSVTESDFSVQEPGVYVVKAYCANEILIRKIIVY